MKTGLDSDAAPEGQNLVPSLIPFRWQWNNTGLHLDSPRPAARDLFQSGLELLTTLKMNGGVFEYHTDGGRVPEFDHNRQCC